MHKETNVIYTHGNNCTNPDSAWMSSIYHQTTKKYGEVKAQLHFHTTEQKIIKAVRKIYNVGNN